MPDLHLHGTRDDAARHPRPAAGARRHRPQHRQREHGRLHAPGAKLTPPSATVPGATGPPQAGQLGTGVDVTPVPAASATSSSTSSSARRRCCKAQPRDRRTACSRSSARSNEPSDNGLNSLLSKYWSAWQDVVEQPGEPGHPAGAGRSRAPASRAASTALASQLATVAVADREQRDLHAQRGQLDRRARSRAERRDRQVDGHRRPAQRPARPARPADRQAVASWATSTVTNGDAGPGRRHDRRRRAGRPARPSADARRDRPDQPHLRQAERADHAARHDDPRLQTKLDTIASTLITPTNTAARGGDRPERQRRRRRSSPARAASTIGVNSALVTNPALIAASGNGQPGNAANALAMAALRGPP